MNKRDIITLSVAALVIAVSIFAIVYLLFPSSGNKNSVSPEVEKIKAVPKTVDEDTLNKLNQLSDYGKPALQNIGKTDLFSN